LILACPAFSRFTNSTAGFDLVDSPAVEGRSYIRIPLPAIETIDTAAILKSEKNPSPAQAGLFDLA
jgi:hypothetical protein